MRRRVAAIVAAQEINCSGIEGLRLLFPPPPSHREHVYTMCKCGIYAGGWLLASPGNAAAASCASTAGAGPRSLSPPNISRSVRTCAACQVWHGSQEGKGVSQGGAKGNRVVVWRDVDAAWGGGVREGGQRTVLSLAIDCLTCNCASVTRMRNRARTRARTRSRHLQPALAAGTCSRHFDYALGIGHITLIMRCGLGILARCARAQSRMVSKWLRSLSSTHHNPCSWSKFLSEKCHASCVRVKRVT
jgi:hypothetical protein